MNRVFKPECTMITETLDIISDSQHEQQAAYEQWLDAEIQEALDDPAPAIAHGEAMRQVRAAIAALQR
jgi:hypothetical protein